MDQFTDIEAVLFDMDGTLIEHTWQLSQITETLFARFQEALAPVTEDEFFEVFWDKNTDMWFMMVEGIITGDTAQEYSYVNTLRALQMDTSLASNMVSYWMELVLQEAVPFSDTALVLETVRQRYKTGIVTNGFISLQQAKIKQYRLDEAVDFYVISEEAGFHKPDARLFKTALQQANLRSPEKVIFVGDTLSADIEGALRAGLQPIFINPDDDQTPPDGVPKIRSLREILPLLSLA